MNKETVMIRGCRTAVIAVALGSLLPAAQAADSMERDGDRMTRLRASATIDGCTDPGIVGAARFVERPSPEGVKLVDVQISVKGLPDGLHAVHIHQTGACAPTCAAAGGHFDPGPYGHVSPDGNHPFHAGDLINLDVRNGRGMLRTTTSRVTLSPGPLGVFDSDGSALIVHIDPDTYCPDGPVPGCAGGGRAACGIIEPVGGDEDEWFD